MTTVIGSRIYDLRRARHMTQEELGNKIGVTKATINKYETGVVPNLKRNRIEALAEALDVTPAYLMGWIDDPFNPKEPKSLQESMANQPHPLEKMFYAATPDYDKIMEVNPEETNYHNKVITEGQLREEETELLKIYRMLDLRRRVDLLHYAFSLVGNK